jgi:hypothetical protein
MTRNTYFSYFLALAAAALAGCSSEPPVKQAAAAPDKIKGKALITSESTPLDAALNAGGPSVYLVDGLNRYRLFFNKAFTVTAGQEYVAEGIYAQKAIDAIGDPDQGKNGYPLQSSCERVVTMAWPGMAFDLTDGQTKSLLAKVKRFPARAVFLVTKIDATDTPKDTKDIDEKEEPKVSVPADKQRALLAEGPSSLPAPLWEPTGGTATCKVAIDEGGKISQLNTHTQLCETVPWSQFRYKPAVKGGKPISVSSEVEVRFDPRK